MDSFEAFERHTMRVQVNLRSASEVEALRKEFVFLKQHDPRYHTQQGYEWHHVIPLKLGGTNDIQNFPVEI